MLVLSSESISSACGTLVVEGLKNYCCVEVYSKQWKGIQSETLLNIANIQRPQQFDMETEGPVWFVAWKTNMGERCG